jgi:hypothetical protein
MPRRPLPSAADAIDILKAKKTRPVYRTATPAGRPLARLVKSLDERFGQGEGGLKARWREIAGDALARRTEPVKLVRRKGAPATLEIRVDGPAATLIQHQAPEILERVNLFLGSGSVDKLRIVQGPVRPAASASSAGITKTRNRRKLPPLDAAEEARLQAELASAPDGPLKSALIRLGREVMRRRT